MSRGSSLGGGSIGSYFDSVTGSNEYERQSWRDSYNDGRAAGDLTGNTNARIEAEREAFQGTTWEGSSSQPSALELARSFVGPGHGSGSTGAASHVGGAGQAQVVMGGPAAAAGNGVGNAVVGPAKTTQIFVGGQPYTHDKGWSDAQDAEDRWGEAELLTPGWFYNWGVWGADTLAGIGGWAQDAKQSYDGPKGQGALPQIVDAFDRFWAPAQSARYGADGTVFRTGGGF